MQSTPHSKDLVLIGGGHSHLFVIKHFAMNPIAGLRITVISQDIHTPYSGMMPGLIAGHYRHDEIHIDLRRLCEWAGIRLFHSSVTNIDHEQQLVLCENRPAVRYDWLSINVGSQPDLKAIKGASEVGIAVKPIRRFLPYLQTIAEDLQQTVTVVGGGAASIEVVLALQYHFDIKHPKHQLQFELISGSPEILPSHNVKVREIFKQQLANKGIRLLPHIKVKAAEKINHKTRLTLDNGTAHSTDTVIWAIHAGSAKWLAKTKLACDEQGFISINQFLQSESHPNVFAAGDTAHFSNHPLPKSGVYAVRAGPKLAQNLHRAICGQALKPYRPQRRFLSLLMTGDKKAVASRGGFNLEGDWVWRWKDYIDQNFMTAFNPTDMPMANRSPTLITKATASQATDSTMRCGGCGSKIADNVLKRVMATLSPVSNSDVTIGLDQPDDAAVITPPVGKQWLQTVDYFRAFIDDPYLLGRIATNHCLSDIYAMGATPHSALAIATVPYANEKIVEDTLGQLMRGAVDSLNEQNTALIGGHSSEGEELGFGLSVNGVIDPENILSKHKLQPGQKLILTKPLGTGTIFAANMQAKAKGRWVDEALAQMLISNQQAAQAIHQHRATACTDITGFGLIGHLLEMLTNSNCRINLRLSSLPLLSGALACIESGLLSSLQPDNMRAEQQIANYQQFNHQTIYPILFDPQTAGGLVAAVPAQMAQACVQQLQQLDCPQAVIIGDIIEQPDEKCSSTNIVLL